MDELEISGKRYLSSRRAGKDYGYHSDYIGQLIRSGRVVGSKVGRTWYVEADSLVNYLTGEKAVASQIQVAPAPTVLPVEQETYTPPPVVHRESAPMPAPEDTIQEIPISIRQPMEEKNTIQAVPITQRGLTYIADDEPLLPEIRSKVMPSRPAVIQERPQEVPRAPLPEKRGSLRGALVVVGLGILILAGVTFGSGELKSYISITPGKPAAVWYSLK